MKNFELTSPEKMLFALLRTSLHQKEPEMSFFQNVIVDDWKECFRLAVGQGVAALAWDGMKKLSPSLYPPLELKLKWGMTVKNCEKNHHHHCRTIHELNAFYASHGISTLQMKGVGFSSYYPVPEHREGGDIDIFTFSADKTKMTDMEANILADELMKREGIDVDVTHNVKHSLFYFRNVSIENHKNFLNVERFPVAIKVESLLRKRMQLQSISLYDGKYRFNVPTAEFNTLFISFHAAQHYGSGLALHHLCDWAMLLIRHGLCLPSELEDKGFLSAINAFTYLCNEYLGTSVSVPEENRLAQEMITEILRPRFKKNIPAKTPLGIMFYKIRRMWYSTNLRKKVLGGSLWILYLPILLRVISHPGILFRKKAES